MRKRYLHLLIIIAVFSAELQAPASDTTSSSRAVDLRSLCAPIIIKAASVEPSPLYPYSPEALGHSAAVFYLPLPKNTQQSSDLRYARTVLTVIRKTLEPFAFFRFADDSVITTILNMSGDSLKIPPRTKRFWLNAVAQPLEVAAFLESFLWSIPQHWTERSYAIKARLVLIRELMLNQRKPHAEMLMDALLYYLKSPLAQFESESQAKKFEQLATSDQRFPAKIDDIERFIDQVMIRIEQNHLDDRSYRGDFRDFSQPQN